MKTTAKNIVTRTPFTVTAKRIGGRKVYTFTRYYESLEQAQQETLTDEPMLEVIKVERV